MQGIMPALQEAISSGIVALATQRDQRKKLGGMGVLLLSGLVFLAAIIFLALACYQALVLTLSPAEALAIMGGVMILLSLLIFFIGRAMMREQEIKDTMQTRREVERLVELVSHDVSHELAGPIRDNPKTSLAAAIVAGFLAGEKIH